MTDQATRFKICPGWNRDEFDKCMDAKLSEEERELKEEKRKGQKVEEEEEKDNEERKKEQIGTHRVEKAATTVAEVAEDTMRQKAINEDAKRRLKLEMSGLT